MIRYSKPLGELPYFKQAFFTANDLMLGDRKDIARIYQSQPERKSCKNCDGFLDYESLSCFTNLGVDFCFCPNCGHCNGVFEDTEVFCRALYTDNRGLDYAENYNATDSYQYEKRVSEIYLPKAKFLSDSLNEAGAQSVRLVDFGAGAGYFVSAAIEYGFNNVIGYEPSETLVDLGNTMIGEDRLIGHDLSEIVELIEQSDATVASFIGVLEHLQNPREVLKAIRDNQNIRFVFFSVPLFSPTVVMESVFHGIMPRHLAGGHTHLYTEDSIEHFCNEFHFKRQSEWWFGLDIRDLIRSVSVSLKSDPLRVYWNDSFAPLVDKLQHVLDEAHVCSEVHMVLEKKELS